MDSIFVFVVVISCLLPTEASKFVEESPYMRVQLMDRKRHEWKPQMLDDMEQALDSELKYSDEKKGTACKSINFEEEKDYPKQDGRFLDLSIRGICTDLNGKEHKIEKDLIIKAIIRRKDEVNNVISTIVFKVGAVQLYERNRNKLNFIIIPVSISFVSLLFIMTFFLRRMRHRQKRDHIIAELEKKRDVNLKKALTIPNLDPHANDKQRLLQLDPTVVGNVSHTMGSSKEFTADKFTPPNRQSPANANDQRTYTRQQQDAPPPIPSKENRAPYYKQDDDMAFQMQRPLKSSRERMHVAYENEPRFSPTHTQYQHEPEHLDMISMQQSQPRVVVRSIREDSNFPSFYQQQTQYQESSPTFVSIPVQIEHSVSHQRFAPPPYHSDPYYPQVNS